MNDPIKLRAEFLTRAAPLMKAYVDVALGNGVLKTANKDVSNKVWKLLEQIVLTADDPTPMARIKDKTISGRVDAVLSQVASGKLTPREAKQHMALLQAGFEIQELPKLMAALEELEE